ncbi:MAG: LuxR C-terminal-related transcriptional regulator [Shinella sp.]|nr:LuxR C-terminal-related transcriptional regulator [Shinella sp.]
MSGLTSLKDKHMTCIAMLADGKSAKQIAHSMGASTNAVYWMIRDAKKAIGVKKETALVATAIREGWIE